MFADVTVMSHDTDTYVCNVVYDDDAKTAKNSTTIKLVNKGTGNVVQYLISHCHQPVVCLL